MTENIFIGVDGGGTSSRLRIENESGDTIGEGFNGPANIRLSVEGTWKSIYAALDDALKQAGLELSDQRYRFHIGCGLAGTELLDACERFVATKHPFTSLILKSDAYTACLGAHNGKDGSIIIIGTGVVGYQIEGDYEVKIGGWGFPQGDEGSGAWLGLEAIRLTLKWQDGRIEGTPMLQEVFAHFNNDTTATVTWSSAAQSSQFGQLAPIVTKHIADKDPWALELINRGAKEIDAIATTMNHKQQDLQRKLPCCLIGGISKSVQPWVSKNLQSRLVHRCHDAVKGAIFMIKKKVLNP